MAAISFFYEDLDFKFSKPRKRSRWIQDAIKNESFKLINLNYIFCSDDYLSQINLEYLNHKSLTDIITFDNSEKKGTIEADIFISIDRVKENASKLATSLDDELDRVMIHGVLHLVGLKDKSPAQKTAMRKKEDAYLSLR